jgi:hypothetical protein
MAQVAPPTAGTPTAGPVRPAPVQVEGARPPPPDPFVWQAGAGGLAAAGAVPGLTVGLLVEGTASRRRWRLGLDLRTYLPAQVALQGGHVTVASYTATASACTRLSRLSACALLVGGVLHGRGHDDLADPRSSWTPRLGPGGRLAVEQPVGPWLTLRLQVDGGGWLTQAKLRVGPQEAWAQPAGWASLALNVVGTIP